MAITEEFRQLLLNAKFSVPEPRPGSVSRAGLIEAARLSGRQIVVVTAPATLLTSVAAAYCLRASAVPFVLMLDDLHEVRSAAGQPLERQHAGTWRITCTIP